MSNIENRLRSLESKLSPSRESFVLIQYDTNKLIHTEIKIGKHTFEVPCDINPKEYISSELKHLLAKKLVIVSLPFKEPLEIPTIIHCEGN